MFNGKTQNWSPEILNFGFIWKETAKRLTNQRVFEVYKNLDWTRVWPLFQKHTIKGSLYKRMSLICKRSFKTLETGSWLILCKKVVFNQWFLPYFTKLDFVETCAFKAWNRALESCKNLDVSLSCILKTAWPNDLKICKNLIQYGSNNH